MISYTKQVGPPAPFLSVTVANRLQRRKRITLLALLDTGSDFTAIPEIWIDKLQLYPTGEIYLEDIKLQTLSVSTYTVRLSVADITISRLEVISTDIEHAIIGRDVLNQLYLQLNGPELTFDVSQTSWK